MTSAASDDLWALFGSGPRGVLVTLKQDGRAQLSNVGYLSESASRSVLISVTELKEQLAPKADAPRAKTRNLRRDPRASFHVTTPDLGAYAVGECGAELGPVTQVPGDPASDQLVDHYRALQGEHPDWVEFREAIVHEWRLLLRTPLARVYGWVP